VPLSCHKGSGMRRTTKTDDHLTFRELLLATRKKNDVTQAEVAKRLGRPQSFVAKVENGERRLDVVELVSYARAIGAEPLAIMREIVEAVEKDTSAADMSR
jgi:transcriptional regulator with XRE-family HTH domain